MGRAIVRDPAVFLFDEPLSNLDAKLRVQMRAEIKALQQRLASTTIYVTHEAIGFEVVLGIRPEHIRLGGPLAVQAQVVVVEPTGSETHVNVSFDGKEIVCVFHERFRCRPGETIALSFQDGPLHFFDARTGLAIAGG